MRRRLSPRPVLVALVGCMLVLGVAGAARADTYGEVGQFTAAVGKEPGELKLTTETHAFGVDPTDNSVYVGDEITKKGEYRIQKLTSSGKFVAETATFTPPAHDGIEGIAIDPALGRVYVLALEKRGEALTIDHDEPAAGTLYAFSTEPSGAVLVPASGTSAGVLAGPSELEPQSDLSEVSLLEPRGITVDPTTHDVIVLGEVQEKTQEEEEPHSHVALQRIHSSGELGERYVDRTNVLGATATPNSPAVSSKGAVYVAVDQVQSLPHTEAGADEIMQIPSNFASTSPPTPFVQLTLRGTFEEESRPAVEFEDNETTAEGGGLSFAPESAGGAGEGAIYVKAHVFVGSSLEGAYYPGVLAFDGVDGAEIGWTGGQTKKSGTACTLGFSGRTYSSVAAGSGGNVFVLDPGKESPPGSPRVVEFGPGGSGCPAAVASEPAASIDGQPLPAEPIPTGTEVTFSSTVTQANALTVEWNFGDGQTQTVADDEFEHTEVAHRFTQGGELTVTETIHTDDLQTPTIVKQTKVSVSATGTSPTAVLEGPTEVVLGGGSSERLIYGESGGLELVDTPTLGEAGFDASASSASTAQGSNRIVAYHWTFGDGHAETTTTATVEHTYELPGAYGVQLTVTDAHGLSSEPVSLIVEVKTAPPSASSGVSTGTTGTTGTTGGAVAGQTPAGLSSSATGPSSSAAAGGLTPALPDVTLKNATLEVARTGTVTLELECPSGESRCRGTVTLRTLGAGGARNARSSTGASTGSSHAEKSHSAGTTIASGAFTIAGGRAKTVTLALTAKARSLLAHSHVLHARATILAHDPAGATHTTQRAVTLRVTKLGTR